MFKCASCGKEIEDDELKICPHCGKKTFKEESAGIRLARTSLYSSPLFKWFIGICLAVIFTICAGVYLLMDGIFDFGSNKVKDFDYSNTFSVMGKDNPAIRYDDFVNNGDNNIDNRKDAIEAATLEIKENSKNVYDKRIVYFDKENRIWAVHFGEYEPGHCVVYINKDGKTVAILNE